MHRHIQYNPDYSNDFYRLPLRCHLDSLIGNYGQLSNIWFLYINIQSLYLTGLLNVINETFLFGRSVTVCSRTRSSFPR